MEWISCEERLPQRDGNYNGKYVHIPVQIDITKGVISLIGTANKLSGEEIAMEYLEWLDEESPSSPALDGWVEDAKKFLSAQEKWEADLIGCDKAWWPSAAKDLLNGKIYEDFILLQDLRNDLQSRIK